MYRWRTYQQRVLSELEEHLSDNHLHIIAPPGSGKTVLGLEVALRLNKPTLILSPTLAIRNQWIDRFCKLFLRTTVTPDWISSDIKSPGFLTVVTYQGLHAACRAAIEEEVDEELEPENEDSQSVADPGMDETKKVVELLRGIRVGTIIADEAHHLKSEWWKTVTEVKEALEPTIVGLTATPPYDVTPLEWERYVELNGPVDAEISVPELVTEGDLCPHQDFVYFSLPRPGEAARIADHRAGVASLFQQIRNDPVIRRALAEHPYVLSPEEHLEEIYSRIEYYSAALIFLKDTGTEITKDHLDLIGDRRLKVPALSYEWMEVLLDFYLFSNDERFGPYEEHKEHLKNKLRRHGVLERRRIDFRHNRKIDGSLALSSGKLQSIQRIIEHESVRLGDSLRLVILTDFVRKEFLSEASRNGELNRIGVVPIFEQIRRSSLEVKLGILSGSLIVLPCTALGELKSTCATEGIDEFVASPLAHDERFVVVTGPDKSGHRIVHVVTSLFEKGCIEVLVGTKSLLGEGWDAPSINTLILASYVGSYVLSNQMRGRAIRAERGNTGKTGNIWHLVCVDPTDPDGGDDLSLLKRRFRAFVGVSSRREAGIENGISRLDLPPGNTTDAWVATANQMMLARSAERDVLRDRWIAALGKGTRIVEAIKIPFADKLPYRETTSLYYRRTIQYAVSTLISGLAAFIQWVLEVFGRTARSVRTMEDVLRFIAVMGALGILIFGRQTFRTLHILLKYRDIAKDAGHIADAVLHSLCRARIIRTDIATVEAVTTIDDLGAISCHLTGGTTFEKSTFLACLQQALGPVRNPRYVIVRKGLFLEVFSQRDYHSVPEPLGTRKDLAEHFADRWHAVVGRCQLVFTRTVEGRRLLLRSRLHSLASEFQDRSERISTWR